MTRIASAFLGAVLLLIPSSASASCYCFEYESRDDTRSNEWDVPEEATVFQGRVLRIRGYRSGTFRVRLDVSRVYQGRVGHTAEVITGGPEHCGFEFTERAEYVVVAFPGPKGRHLQTTACTATTRLTAERPPHLRYLGPGVPPVAGGGGSPVDWVWWSVGLTLFLVGAAGVDARFSPHPRSRVWP